MNFGISDPVENRYKKLINDEIEEYIELWHFIKFDEISISDTSAPLRAKKWILKENVDGVKLDPVKFQNNLDVFWMSVYSALISWIKLRTYNEKLATIYKKYQTQILKSSFDQNELQVMRFDLRCIEEDFWLSCGNLFYRISSASAYGNKLRLLPNEYNLNSDRNAYQYVIDFLGQSIAERVYKPIEGIIQLRGHIIHRAINFALLTPTSIEIMDPFNTDWSSFRGGEFIEYDDLIKYKYTYKKEIVATVLDDMTFFFKKWLEHSVNIFKIIENKLLNKQSVRVIENQPEKANPVSFLHGSGTAVPYNSNEIGEAGSISSTYKPNINKFDEKEKKRK